MFDKQYEKQLNTTLKVASQYTKEREKLKNMFYDEYDSPTIYSLINLLVDKGHPIEKNFAKSFQNLYESGNFSESEVKEFERLKQKYKEALVDFLSQ